MPPWINLRWAFSARSSEVGTLSSTMTDGPANRSVSHRLQEGLSRGSLCTKHCHHCSCRHRDNPGTPHTRNLTAFDLFRFSSSGFNCLAPLGTAGSEQLKPLKRLWKLPAKCSGVSLQFSSCRREGRLRDEGAVTVGKGTWGIDELSLAIVKPAALKRHWGRVWQLPLHASLHRALLFCRASQMWEKLLRLPKQQFILLFQGSLIWAFCSLAWALCPLHPGIWHWAWTTAQAASRAGWMLQESLAGKQQLEGLQCMAWLRPSCELGQGHLEQGGCLPMSHFLNPRDMACHFSEVIISVIDKSIHSHTVPTFPLPLPWGLICLWPVQLNYFLNLFVNQFSWLMQSSGCWEQRCKIYISWSTDSGCCCSSRFLERSQQRPHHGHSWWKGWLLSQLFKDYWKGQE